MMNRNRRNIAMTLGISAGFLVAGQAAAQQNRNSGAGKKSQQSQNTKQEPGTQQPQQSQENQVPRQQPQSGRSVSGQQATQQGNSTGSRVPTTGSGALDQSVPLATSSKPGRASAPTQTSRTQNPLNSSSSRGPNSRNRGSIEPSGRSDSAPNAGTTPPTTPGVVAPTPGGKSSDASSALGVAVKTRTALEVLGEELFKEMGLPEESRNVDLPTALYMGRQKVIRDEHGIPKDSTQNMAPEDMLEIVAKLALFDVE